MTKDVQAAVDRLRDWEEDFADDNGQYFHICDQCGKTYQAHKRRSGSCKRCWVAFAEKAIPDFRIQIADLEKALADATTRAERAEKAKWIPVSERLPETYGKCLVTVRSAGRILTRYGFFNEADKTFARVHTDKRYEEVLAWMPLPEPYKEASND